RGKFYPKGLRQKDELSYAAGKFRSVEINGTFYSLQRPESFRCWRDATPEDFVFAVKGARYITHLKRLKEIEAPLANFFASGVLALEEKLGPILWQLPPNFRFDAKRLSAFFDLLPRDGAAAARLAKGHDAKLKRPPFTRCERVGRLRHALEIRHESFRDAEFIRLLRAHDIALVAADTVEWPLLMDVTADFVYVRLHGSRQLYASGYGPKALQQWAGRIKAWARGKEAEGEHAGPPAHKTSGRKSRDVYVCFDNDAKVRAPADAEALAALLR
ncbi:MAG TPA: DUF72 domain-containing protein, partial [Rhizomicrobium sp.]|nr:DUF72 domain-containing protein [Rhizomicrobium sp.]